MDVVAGVKIDQTPPQDLVELIGELFKLGD